MFRTTIPTLRRSCIRAMALVTLRGSTGDRTSGPTPIIRGRITSSGAIVRPQASDVANSSRLTCALATWTNPISTGAITPTPRRSRRGRWPDKSSPGWVSSQATETPGHRGWMRHSSCRRSGGYPGAGPLPRRPAQCKSGFAIRVLTNPWSMLLLSVYPPTTCAVELMPVTIVYFAPGTLRERKLPFLNTKPKKPFGAM